MCHYFYNYIARVQVEFVQQGFGSNFGQAALGVPHGGGRTEFPVAVDEGHLHHEGLGEAYEGFIHGRSYPCGWLRKRPIRASTHEKFVSFRSEKRKMCSHS